MIIHLPEKDFLVANKHGGRAYVRDGTLYIIGRVDFEDLMYDITYQLKGYEVCSYCRKKLTSSNCTMDHLFPRRYGGVSVPSNLKPCCKRCNEKKRDMSLEQFQIYRKLTSDKKRKFYYDKCVNKNIERCNKEMFILPRKWYDLYDISKIIKYSNFKKLSRDKMDVLSDYYNKNKHYPQPIVVSKNGRLLKGKHIVYHAKLNGISFVPAVILENVIVTH